jgi:hypothetical protein
MFNLFQFETLNVKLIKFDMNEILLNGILTKNYLSEVIEKNPHF